MSAYEYVSTPKSVSDWIRGHILGEPTFTLRDLDQVVTERFGGSFCAVREQCGRSPVLAADLHFARAARLRMGTLRYGSCGTPRYAYAESARKHLESYQADGNLEHLADALNLCELEWTYPSREGTRWDGPVTTCGLDNSLTAQAYLVNYSLWGQREYLAAAANAIELEWIRPLHPGAHFAAADDSAHYQEEL